MKQKLTGQSWLLCSVLLRINSATLLVVAISVVDFVDVVVVVVSVVVGVIIIVVRDTLVE